MQSDPLTLLLCLCADDALSPPMLGVQQKGLQPAVPASGGAALQRPPSPLRMTPLESLGTRDTPPGGLWTSPSRTAAQVGTLENAWSVPAYGLRSLGVAERLQYTGSDRLLELFPVM